MTEQLNWTELHSGRYIFPFLLHLLLLFSQLFVALLKETFFPFAFFLGMVLITTSYTMLQTSVHSSSGTLSTRSTPFNLFVTSIPEWSNGLPYFLQFNPELCNMECIVWATASSRSCFSWLYWASPCLAVKNIINLNSVLTMCWCPYVESSLVLLEEGVCYDQCVLLAKLC